MERLSFEIPCPHETSGLIDCSDPLPDYHPLGRNRLLNLLNMASSSTDPQLIAKIHIRLAQAIPGMTCPSPVDGSAALKSNQLDTLYVRAHQEGILPLLNHRFMKLFE